MKEPSCTSVAAAEIQSGRYSRRQTILGGVGAITAAVLGGASLAGCNGSAAADPAASPSSPAARVATPAEKLAAIQAWAGLSADAQSLDSPALTAPLDKQTAAAALKVLVAARLSTLRVERKDEMTLVTTNATLNLYGPGINTTLAGAGTAETGYRSLTLGGKTLNWLQVVMGAAPADGRSLWISMHGGGETDAATNDQQWYNQYLLYAAQKQPAEGIYVAPRAPENLSDMWYRPYIDGMFQRLIDDQVALNGVNPDKVYLLGYSAGGDGVWQLAPRMADRFAAASMMAGHPNGISVRPLRDLPFGVFVGEDDTEYGREPAVAEKITELEALHSNDPAGYTTLTRIYPGLGHWMDGKDVEALPWMAQFTRNDWPTKIIWDQGNPVGDRFYWLGLSDTANAKVGDEITASVNGQNIVVDGQVPVGMTLRLSDTLLDLDQPVQVTVNGRVAYNGLVARTAGAMQRSLLQRMDGNTAAMALLQVS